MLQYVNKSVKQGTTHRLTNLCDCGGLSNCYMLCDAYWKKTSLGKFLIFGKHITQDKNALKKYTNRNFIIFVKKNRFWRSAVEFKLYLLIMSFNLIQIELN